MEFKILNNYIVNSYYKINDNQESKELHIEISGNVSFSKNKDDVHVKIIFCLGGEDQQFIFNFETVTKIEIIDFKDENLENQKDEIQKSCSKLALNQVLKKARELVRIYDISETVIPNINDLIED